MKTPTRKIALGLTAVMLTGVGLFCFNGDAAGAISKADDVYEIGSDSRHFPLKLAEHIVPGGGGTSFTPRTPSTTRAPAPPRNTSGDRSNIRVVPGGNPPKLIPDTPAQVVPEEPQRVIPQGQIQMVPQSQQDFTPASPSEVIPPAEEGTTVIKEGDTSKTTRETDGWFVPKRE